LSDQEFFTQVDYTNTQQTKLFIKARGAEFGENKLFGVMANLKLTVCLQTPNGETIKEHMTYPLTNFAYD
jgi:hypothetical protein